MRITLSNKTIAISEDETTMEVAIREEVIIPTIYYADGEKHASLLTGLYC